MYCEHCGNEVSKTDRFCECCGAPQEVEQNNIKETLKKTTTTFQDWFRGHKKLLIFGALAVVLAVGILMGVDYIKTFIDPGKYLVAKISGYNGRGTIGYDFDEDSALALKLLGDRAAGLEALVDENASEEMQLLALASYFELSTELENIEHIFSVGFESSDVLQNTYKNGDSFTVRIDVDREKLKSYGFRTTKPTYLYTFEIGKDTHALPEPTQLDLFSCLDIKISGVDGYGLLCNIPIEKEIPLDAPIDGVHSFRVITEAHEGVVWQRYVRFEFLDESGVKIGSTSLELEAAQTENLSSGDEVTVKILNADYPAKYGVILREKEKTFKADKLRLMEEIDLIGALEYTFGGTDGYGYIQFVPGTYEIPVQNAENGEKTLTVEVTEDQNYDVYADYNGRPNVPVNFVVHLTENMKSNIRIVVYAEPYDKLTNGDTVNFGIYEWSCKEDIEKLKSAGYTIATGHTAQVSGLLAPMEVKLSDILEYQITWNSDGTFDLTVGTTKTTELPENSLGIQQLVTTLGEKDPSYPKYPVTFEFTTTDQNGNVQAHSITSDIYIQKDSWWNKVKFDMTQRQCRELRDYGIVITEPYEMFDVASVS